MPWRRCGGNFGREGSRIHQWWPGWDGKTRHWSQQWWSRQWKSAQDSKNCPSYSCQDIRIELSLLQSPRYQNGILPWKTFPMTGKSVTLCLIAALNVSASPQVCLPLMLRCFKIWGKKPSRQGWFCFSNQFGRKNCQLCQQVMGAKLLMLNCQMLTYLLSSSPSAE